MRESLKTIWPRLGVDALADLLRHVDARWQARKGYVEGPCPVGVGSCAGDARAAYVYPRTDGWPPLLRCHHGSCGHQETLYDALAAKLGKKAALFLIRRRPPPAAPAPFQAAADTA